jgi:hypothetical protein
MLGNKYAEKHGMHGTPEYRSWQGAKQRCLNPEDDHYPSYGGRGIQICEEWRDDFTAFFAHMGHRPTILHSLDRINVDGNYEPGNCRWATASEQQRNKRPSALRNTHCKRGHNFDEVGWYKSGLRGRSCAQCAKDRARAART